MASYYYLMAQLPAVLPNADPPISYAQFKELALRFLKPADAEMLELLSLPPSREVISVRSRFVTAWLAFERSLRTALEQMRAAKLKQEVPAVTEGGYSAFDIAAIIRTVSAIDDPLAAEQVLLKARIRAAEELRKLHFFDSDAVFGYGIVLLLTERAAKFKMEAGREEYHSVYTQILGEKI